jgi:tRNA pseudouridine synthase 10
LVKTQGEFENSKSKKIKNSNQLQIPLCSFCYDRNFSKNKMSLVKYTVSVKIIKTGMKVCYICRNFFLRTLPSIVDEISNSEMFNSTTCILPVDIGTSLPFFFYENEDYLRSMFQIKGTTGIKTQTNLLIREKIRKNKKCTIDHVNPELKFDVVIENDLSFNINCKTREFYLLGRYIKLDRGIAQKDKNWIKMDSQTFHKLIDRKEDSIEHSIRKSVWSEYNAENMKITWTGSEDKYSLVLGSGRPFIVKVINPKIKGPDEKKVLEKDVELYFKKINHDEIDYYSKYRILVTIFVKLNEKVRDFGHFQRLVQTLTGEVTFRVKNKKTTRNIYFARLVSVECDKLEISLDMDNGIPIKQFVGGNEPIEPCLSNTLETKCECIYFDINDVILNK